MKPEIIYTPKNSLKKPLQLLQQMKLDILASRQLAYRLMIRDLTVQYRQSLLGITWAFLPSIITAIGFTLANEANVIKVGKTDIPYPAYVMFSTALWQTFIEALNAPLQAVTAAKPILTKINFPREALIIAKLGETSFNFSIKLILIFCLFLWFQIPITWTIILAPIAIIHLILFGTFIGLLLTPIGILYQDISKAITLISGFWLFLTPIIYPVPNQGLFGLLVKINPVTPLIVTIRELSTTGILSQAPEFWLVSGITLIGLFLTWISFRLAMPFVIEKIGS
jgi:lipopolysaccharide transport system permease protein